MCVTARYATLGREYSGSVRIASVAAFSFALFASHLAAGALDSSACADPHEKHPPSEIGPEPLDNETRGPTISFRGRVYGNYEAIDLPSTAVNGARESAVEIRRADLTIGGSFWGGSFWGGSFWEDLSYRFKAGFRTGELDIKDASISYDAGIAVISVGQLGPIDELTQPAYREFMEGSAIEEAFAPGNQTGISVLRESEIWTFAGGVFRGAIDPGEAEEGWTYAGRVTFAPQLSEGRLLHVGSYFSWRKGEEGKAIYGYAARSLLRTGERYVDTDAVADEDMLFGMELAGGIRSVSLESQCAVIRAFLVASRQSTSHFNGCYAALSWFLTGETRNYGGGGFSMVDVGRPVSDGGPGAWQAAVRYDRIELNDGDIVGGSQNGWTFALNWYLSNQFWLAANYSGTTLERGAEIEGRTDGVGLRIHYQIRW